MVQNANVILCPRKLAPESVPIPSCPTGTCSEVWATGFGMSSEIVRLLSRSGFKSQLCHALVVWFGAVYLTSPSLIFPSLPWRWSCLPHNMVGIKWAGTQAWSGFLLHQHFPLPPPVFEGFCGVGFLFGVGGSGWPFFIALVSLSLSGIRHHPAELASDSLLGNTELQEGLESPPAPLEEALLPGGQHCPVRGNCADPAPAWSLVLGHFGY